MKPCMSYYQHKCDKFVKLYANLKQNNVCWFTCESDYIFCNKQSKQITVKDEDENQMLNVVGDL